MKPYQSRFFFSVSRCAVQRNLKSLGLPMARLAGSWNLAVAALCDWVSRYVIACPFVKRAVVIGWPAESKRTHECASKFDQLVTQSQDPSICLTYPFGGFRIHMRLFEAVASLQSSARGVSPRSIQRRTLGSGYPRSSPTLHPGVELARCQLVALIATRSQ